MITYLIAPASRRWRRASSRDLGLSTVQMGYVFTVFQLAYALFEIPTAGGPTARAPGRCSRGSSCGGPAYGRDRGGVQLPVLLAIRFLFGVGEAGAWPCVARTFSRWIPRARARAVQGIFFAGAHLVGGLTPALVL